MRAEPFRTEYLWPREEKLRRWGEGAWLDEPDVMEWDVEAVRCFARRHFHLGVWILYVGIAPGHPRYGDRCDGDDIGGKVSKWANIDEEFPGLPYDPSPTDEPLWWVGHVMAGSFDVIPVLSVLAKRAGMPDPQPERPPFTYKTFRWVRSFAEDLAGELMQAIRALS